MLATLAVASLMAVLLLLLGEVLPDSAPLSAADAVKELVGCCRESAVTCIAFGAAVAAGLDACCELMSLAAPLLLLALSQLLLLVAGWDPTTWIPLL
jgi:hypothetical protein